MKKTYFFVLSILAIITFLILYPENLARASDDKARIITGKATNDQFKNWKITFNQPVAPSTVSNEKVIIYDNLKNKVEETELVMTDENKLIVYAPKKGYKPGRYLMEIKDLYSMKGKKIKPTKFQFTVERNYVVQKHIIDYKEPIDFPEKVKLNVQGEDKEYKVSWDREDVQILGNNEYVVSGQVKDKNTVVYMKFLVDELYIKDYVERIGSSLTAEVQGDKELRDAKVVEFFMKNLYNADSLTIDKLIVDHINSSSTQQLMDVILRRMIGEIQFNKESKEEKEIVACLSDMMVARAFINLSDTASAAKKCSDTIFTYLEDTLDIDKSDVTAENINTASKYIESYDKTLSDYSYALSKGVNGINGYWFLYSDDAYGKPNDSMSSLLYLKEKDDEIKGNIYRVVPDLNNAEFKNKIEGQFNKQDMLVSLKEYLGKDEFNAYVKYFDNHTLKYSDGYYRPISFSPEKLSGKFTVNGYGRYEMVYLNELNIKLIRVKKPKSLFYNEFDYLKDLKNAYIGYAY